MGAETVYLPFNPTEIQAEGCADAEKEVNVLPISECDGSEDQAPLSRTC